MSQKNEVSFEMTDTNRQAILQQVVQLKQQLSHLLLFNLTPEDRHSMVKMGDKTIAFVGKALDYAAQNPDLVPAYVSLDEAVKDYRLFSQLNEIARQLATLTTSLEDTIMVSGSEAYDAALQFYGSVKGASRSNTPGSQAIYDDLSSQFPARRSKAKKTGAS